jgi:hypothetical protein
MKAHSLQSSMKSNLGREAPLENAASKESAPSESFKRLEARNSAKTMSLRQLLLLALVFLFIGLILPTALPPQWNTNARSILKWVGLLKADPVIASVQQDAIN